MDISSSIYDISFSLEMMGTVTLSLISKPWLQMMRGWTDILAGDDIISGDDQGRGDPKGKLWQVHAMLTCTRQQEPLWTGPSRSMAR